MGEMSTWNRRDDTTLPSLPEALTKTPIPPAGQIDARLIAADANRAGLGRRGSRRANDDVVAAGGEAGGGIGADDDVPGPVDEIARRFGPDEDVG